MTGVATKVLTRFPTNGTTPEPELMFPVDLHLAPSARHPPSSPHARARPLPRPRARRAGGPPGPRLDQSPGGAPGGGWSDR